MTRHSSGMERRLQGLCDKFDLRLELVSFDTRIVRIVAN